MFVIIAEDKSLATCHSTTLPEESAVMASAKLTVCIFLVQSFPIEDLVIGFSGFELTVTVTEPRLLVQAPAITKVVST